MGMGRLREARVCVIGLGGVGSWAAEALARSGIGALTLVDMDDVCISNVNRQLHALDGEFGRPKVEVMERRIRAINPECATHALQTLFVASNAEEILTPGHDFVIDAIDNPPLKALLISGCVQRGIPVITVGGAGGRRDPAAIHIADLSESFRDSLLQCVRRELRKHHGFPRNGLPMGVECVFSREQPVFPLPDGSVCAQGRPGPDLRLDCASGYGTASFVTGAMGFAAASRAVARLAQEPGMRKPAAGACQPSPAASPAGES